MAAYLITTMDNPNNPFTNPDEWYAFDYNYGYETLRWLAHFSDTSTLMEDEDYEYEVNQACDRLLAEDPFGLYIKITADNADDVIKAANEVFQKEIRPKLPNYGKPY